MSAPASSDGAELAPHLVEGVTKPAGYQRLYSQFLAATDEKTVIAEAISDAVGEGTILDVGGGSGDVPELMGIDPARYVAVECQPEFVTSLRRKGYSVVDGLFPCDVGGPYDNVVLSHCLTGSIAHCELMTTAAFAATTPRGRLVLVTFDDTLDDYNALMYRVGHTTRGSQGKRSSELVDMMSGFGSCSRTNLTSHLMTNSFEHFTLLLSFMATNSNIGTAERREEVRRALQRERRHIDRLYRELNGAYRMPIRHLMLIVRKA